MTDRNSKTTPFADASLFLRRWAAHPLRVAAVFPTSDRHAEMIGNHVVRSEDEVVLEFGAGTGAISRALVKAGLPEKNLLMVELDPTMAAHLQDRFPDATVVRGDAYRPDEIVPEGWRGRITTSVSGLPFLHVSLSQQQHFINSVFDAMADGGRFLQYTSVPVPPLPHKRLGLDVKRLGFGWSKLGPRFVWQFAPQFAAEKRKAG